MDVGAPFGLSGALLGDDVRLLLSNDDGIDARGLTVLTAALVDHEVWVVAPDGQRSAQSHAITLHAPLRVQERGARRLAVSGTPADAVYVGLHGWLDVQPDLVISGINHGSNLGNDVHYSGTVAAAREAVIAGIPGIAVSLHGKVGQPLTHFDTAAQVVCQVVERFAERGLPAHTVLNVNVPDVPAAELRGITSAVLGPRQYDNRVQRRTDPFGRDYFWIGGEHMSFGEKDDTDGTRVEQGWATVTPLHTDSTHHSFMESLSGWFDL